MKEKYIRKPIILDKNTLMLIHIFTKYDSIEDFWMTDMEPYIEKNYAQYKESANQLLDQLENHWCILFMQELILGALQKIKDHDINYNCKFYKETLTKINNVHLSN